MSDQNQERDRGRRLKQEGLAFFGAITASLSHELNNAFAIINEHGGLLQDLLLGTQQGVPMDDRKLQRISRKIGAQVERGNALIRRLNRFAHSADSESREIDLAELLGDIVGLSQRLAGLRMMQLELRPGPEPVRLVSNPFFLQQAVFVAFQLFWDNAEANRLVTVVPEASGPGVRIVIAGARTVAPEASGEKRELLSILMEELRGEAETRSEGAAGQAIVLTLSRGVPASVERPVSA